MSKAEIEAAIARYAEAWKSGDRTALAECYHDDFTLHYGGSNPLSGVHAGKPAALKILMEVSRRTKRKLEAIVDVLAGDERAAVIARERFERDGEVAVLERTLVYTIKDGKLHLCWVYDQDQELVDRFLA